jgi:type IX secretion system PorP/SprF family membrane protein
MRIILIISALLILTCSGINAQVAHFTQYMFNDFVTNPAVAGTNSYYQIRSNHRFQWIGLTDPPLTNTLSVYGPSSKQPMGVGGYIYNDVTGPTSRTGVSGSYAYNVAINNDIRLSMGLSMGMLQYKIDGTQLSPKDISDLSIQPVVYSTYVPDASVGVYAYSDDVWYAGLSVTQLFNNNLKIFDEKNGMNRIKSHIYITGGYKYEIDRDFAIEPSAIIKISAPRMFQFDISTRVIWQEMVWGGLAYRHKDACSILLGYAYDEKFYFGYAYDLGINSMRKYNSGSHEIMIGYRFKEMR